MPQHLKRHRRETVCHPSLITPHLSSKITAQDRIRSRPTGCMRGHA